jgi:glutathione S-transferase
MLTIVLGSKNYSSWSMRAWLALAHTGSPFEEVVVRLGQPDTAAKILPHSPSRRVPALKDGANVVWDSMAIAEYLHERFPVAQLWPGDPGQRARARSLCAEMHAGFTALRSALPMNIRRSAPHVPKTPEVIADVGRITQIWRDELQRSGGPFLFGRFTIADAFFAPVATRFRTYGVRVDDPSRRYVEHVLGLPISQRWIEAAKQEPWSEPKYDL